MKRREVLAAMTLPPLLGISACDRTPHEIAGEFKGVSLERGHLLRSGKPLPAPVITRRTSAIIAGGGIAGLAAARALRMRGIEDFAVLELEDAAGGNSRSHTMQGINCPTGAHYLPVPNDSAHEVQDLLEELGLRKRVAGRWQYDEMSLVHTPQERLYFNGIWQDGLLPMADVSESTIAQYRHLASLVDNQMRSGAFAIPAARGSASGASVLRSLSTITFKTWLANNSLDDERLIWYLDYCCRDDYGAGIGVVSAWAGLHYFASRHGFSAPGEGSSPDATSGVLTWPEGNGWLSAKLASPLGSRVQTGCVITRIEETRKEVVVDLWNVKTERAERWIAPQCIVALPVFIASRIVVQPPKFLVDAAARTSMAAWLVANIAIDAPLDDRPGAPLSWDNVIYGVNSLGYVDAGHQRLDPRPLPTVLTWYKSLGNDLAARRELEAKPWTAWRDEIVRELGVPHPDIADKAARIDITRYGHGMAVPTPVASGLPFAPMEISTRRISFAHSDWSRYSVFEEAFTRGHIAGSRMQV